MAATTLLQDLPRRAGQSVGQPLCRACREPLSADAAAIYRRLVNRGAVDCLCVSCLADHFKCPVPLIEDKIRHFKALGCTLFAPEQN